MEKTPKTGEKLLDGLSPLIPLLFGADQKELELGGDDMKKLLAKKPEELVLISGPEGGFDEKEENLALDSGCHPISLGPRILRAETAGAAAISLIQCFA